VRAPSASSNEKRKSDRRHTVSKAIKQYARAVHLAIARRDDLASILAISAAHIAMHGELY